jgi:NAD(P)H-quinone oxidoreductase subunit 5
VISPESWIHALGALTLAFPALLVAILGAFALLEYQPGERLITRLTQYSITAALLCALGAIGLMAYLGIPRVPINLGEWAYLPDGSFHFSLKIVFDHLSAPFVVLSLALSAVVGSFSIRYLHKEPGLSRYFFLYSMFVLGMSAAALADTIETLFIGWELVGLSSALLVSFFHERASPVRGGLWVWVVYRVADAALLLAAVVLHNSVLKGGSLSELFGASHQGGGQPAAPPDLALVVGLLLLAAAAGKSGLVPFSGWLPRAMEGPTASSAVYYGALSVHLGAFLLLRMSPLLAASATLSWIVIALGLTTAALASLSASVQTDVKSSLSFASLAQVGVIVAEIGFGLTWVALVHLTGNACLRTLQFLRSPSYIQDQMRIQNAIGGRVGRPVSSLLPASAQQWLYRLAMERGSLDVLLWDWIAWPFVRLLRGLDRLDRWWASQLDGSSPGAVDDRDGRGV